VTLDYDALNRLTKVTYPDDTFEEAIYDRLDVGEIRDRLGRVTRFRYDGARRLTSVIDAAQRIVQLAWCACGSLEALVDAKGQRTTWACAPKRERRQRAKAGARRAGAGDAGGAG
jgi:YD repeat-containing protein